MPDGNTTARRVRRLTALAYVAPAGLVYAGFALWPAVHTAYMSFLHWDGISAATPAGLSNYRSVLTDPAIGPALWHAIVLIGFFAVIPCAIGLLLTALLQGGVRGMTGFRVVFFLPQVLPMVAVGITWRWLYADDGLVNQALRAVGLGGVTRAWLGDYNFALIALGLIGTWAMSGLCMVLFLAGAQKIDVSLYEAVALDGGGAVRRFFTVTLPALRGEITIASVITTIAALASFDLAFVTTNGGPVNRTTVPGLLVYRLAFNESDIGRAAALAVVLTIVVIVFVTAIRRLTRERP
ncbi:carbohydrate ABC transporter permease [Actinoplanes sp. NPDC051513]|uniref:carbohydrate ABC transporter permease n=1 Tax=Actinoplanes sp. NPDC051513 TaxID=3363908 RepID=UPI0037BBA6FA